MNSVIKTPKCLAAFFAMLIAFHGSDCLPSNFGKYAGTYSGKFKFTGDFPVESRLNEITVAISRSGEISIAFAYDNIYNVDAVLGEGHGNMTDRASGSATGQLSEDLTFQISGNITYYINHEGEKQGQWTFYGKIADGNITGELGTAGQKKFSIPLESGEQPPNDTLTGDCDCAIMLPQGQQPGGSIYVVVNSVGCVKSTVIYYNGKDNPVTNWDGKPVRVEVQVSCCNHRAFTKSFTIPAYESNEKIEVVTTEVSKAAPLPPSPPGQTLIGTTVGLAIVKLLEALVAGRGGGSGPVPPPAPPRPPVRNAPPVSPGPVEPPNKGKPKGKPNIDLNPVLKKDENLERLWKESKRKDLRARQKQLEDDAAKEKKYTGYNPLVLAGQMKQTVTGSYNEVNDLAFRSFEKYFDIKQKIGDFKTQYEQNPEEARRLMINTGIMLEHAKKAISGYVTSGGLKNDLFDAGKNIVHTNLEFMKNMATSPVKTVTEYTKGAIGTENWKNSLDMNAPLETRLLNAGAGIWKTCSSLGISNMGAGMAKKITEGQPLTLIDGLKAGWMTANHHKNLYLPKLEESMPGMAKTAKVKVVLNTAQVKYKHFMNHPQESGAPMVHNVNDWMEHINQSFEK